MKMNRRQYQQQRQNQQDKQDHSIDGPETSTEWTGPTVLTAIKVSSEMRAKWNETDDKTETNDRRRDNNKRKDGDLNRHRQEPQWDTGENH